MPYEMVRDIMALAKKYNLFLISDEIYSAIVFDKPHTSALMFHDHINPEQSNLAIISGVSKAYAMTGNIPPPIVCD